MLYVIRLSPTSVLTSLAHQTSGSQNPHHITFAVLASNSLGLFRSQESAGELVFRGGPMNLPTTEYHYLDFFLNGTHSTY